MNSAPQYPNFPPSLSQGVLSRSSRASNGEIGVLPGDAMEFLNACEADDLEVLGWELWIVDHKCHPVEKLLPAPWYWCGLIPRRGQPLPGIIHGEGDLADNRAMMRNLDLNDIEPRWRPCIRINFTLDSD
jgi:hypothetical protein